MERHFFERGKGNVLQKLPWTASDEQNLEAPVVTLRLQNQKNGWKSAYMSQHDNGLGYNSPTVTIEKRYSQAYHKQERVALSVFCQGLEESKTFEEDNACRESTVDGYAGQSWK